LRSHQRRRFPAASAVRDESASSRRIRLDHGFKTASAHFIGASSRRRIAFALTDFPSRHSSPDFRRRHIVRHYGASANNGPIADLDATQNNHIRPQPAISTDVNIFASPGLQADRAGFRDAMIVVDQLASGGDQRLVADGDLSSNIEFGRRSDEDTVTEANSWFFYIRSIELESYAAFNVAIRPDRNRVRPSHTHSSEQRAGTNPHTLSAPHHHAPGIRQPEVSQSKKADAPSPSREDRSH
jgi:hypothetical protein